jgi:hypothetical protein
MILCGAYSGLMENYFCKWEYPYLFGLFDYFHSNLVIWKVKP